MSSLGATASQPDPVASTSAAQDLPKSTSRSKLVSDDTIVISPKRRIIYIFEVDVNDLERELDAKGRAKIYAPPFGSGRWSVALHRYPKGSYSKAGPQQPPDAGKDYLSVNVYCKAGRAEKGREYDRTVHSELHFCPDTPLARICYFEGKVGTMAKKTSFSYSQMCNMGQVSKAKLTHIAIHITIEELSTSLPEASLPHRHSSGDTVPESVEKKLPFRIHKVAKLLAAVNSTLPDTLFRVRGRSLLADSRNLRRPYFETLLGSGFDESRTFETGSPNSGGFGADCADRQADTGSGDEEGFLVKIEDSDGDAGQAEEDRQDGELSEPLAALEGDSDIEDEKLYKDRLPVENKAVSAQEQQGAIVSPNGIAYQLDALKPYLKRVEINDTSFITFRAMLGYLQTGAVSFTPLTTTYKNRWMKCISPDPLNPTAPPKLGRFAIMPSCKAPDVLEAIAGNACSPKSAYRLADKLMLGDLKVLAHSAIIQDWVISSILQELQSPFYTIFIEAFKEPAADYLVKYWNFIAIADGFATDFAEIFSSGSPDIKKLVTEAMASLSGGESRMKKRKAGDIAA